MRFDKLACEEALLKSGDSHSRSTIIGGYTSVVWHHQATILPANKVSVRPTHDNHPPTCVNEVHVSL